MAGMNLSEALPLQVALSVQNVMEGLLLFVFIDLTLWEFQKALVNFYLG